MKGKYIYILLFSLLLLFTWAPLLTDAANMNDYTLTPPFVTQVVPPNILLVLDASGSMQFPAYLGCDWNYYSSSRAQCGSDTSTSDPGSSYDYDYSTMDDELIRDYFGYFDPEKYYEYDSGNSKFIESTSGCSFVPGAVGYKIGDNSGNCISGNVLNWAAMSRVDLLRKALMGGKSVADLGGGVHTLRGEGGWRTFTDANLDCTFDISGGTYPALDHVISISNTGGAVCTPDGVYSDNFNDTTVDAKWTAVDIGDASGGSQWESGGDLYVRANGSRIWDTSDDFRYVYQSVSGDFDIRLRIMNAPDTNSSSKATLMVRETTADNSKHVMISMRGSESQLQFAYRGTTGGDTYYAASSRTRYSPEWVRLVRTGNTFRSYYSEGGTIWTYRSGSEVSVTMTDPVLIGMAVSAYSSSYGNGVFDEFVYCGAALGGCAVGSITAASIRVDTDDRTGVVQEVADTDGDGLYDENSPRFGVEVFASDNRDGCIREGVTDTLADVISAIESEVPYYGTPTKAGLEEAWDYFAQSNAHSGNCDSAVIYPGTAADPFYVYDQGGSLVPVPCKKSYVLLISDGEYSGGTTDEPVPVALDSHMNDMRTPTVNDLEGIQVIDYYSFFIFGSTGAGRNSMQQIAMFGGFDDDDDPGDSGYEYPYPNTSNPGDSRNVTLPYGTSPNTICDPLNLPMDSECEEWDDNSDGIPDNYFEAESGKELKAKLLNAILEILDKASSGTAASVLASGEGSGANLVQAVFYPERAHFDSVRAKWLGSIQNLWYYIDPRFTSSSIREDSDKNGVLHLINDYMVQFYFDDQPPDPTYKTLAERTEDTLGDYSLLTYKGTIEFERLRSIWNAGHLLWNRDLIANDRTIKTSIGSSFINFTPSEKTTLKPYLQAGSDAESEAIIRWTHGFDANCSVTTSVTCSDDSDCPGVEVCTLGGNPGSYRTRTVAIDLNSDDDVNDTVYGISESPKVWKLGDIVNSTPKVLSWVPLNKFYRTYNDLTYKKFINSPDYLSRGLVFAGANDGVLHAFKMGTLQLKEDPDWEQEDFEQARLLNGLTACSITDSFPKCGDEIWAFVPENVLPYLKYMADPDYAHVYAVDSSPYIFDSSIGGAANRERPADGSTWRTVLIGGMRLGGASKATNDACTDCVKAPWVDLDGDGVMDVGEDLKGMSSYFAIDITDSDPANWSLLWEFSNEDIPAAERATGGLGFTTTHMSGMRVNAAECKTVDGLTDIYPKKRCNGEWFMIIPSGPTGPIDTTAHQFLGNSDQNLKFFVLDLRTGNLVTTINTGITNAFAGFAGIATVDPDNDYQDDALYVGFAKKCTAAVNDPDGVPYCTPPAAPDEEWTDGGVLRLTTLEDPDPANWEWSYVMDDIGPVVTAIDRLENSKTGKLWLFFGSGRYFYRIQADLDDFDNQRKLYGIKDPCYSNSSAPNYFASSCTDGSSRTANMVDDYDLLNVTSTNSAAEDNEGWYINLEGANVPDTGYGAERVVTNTVALTAGCVFYTTFKPTADMCGYRGNTYLWAVEYNTGGTCDLDGRALLQVSTGSVEEKEIPKEPTCVSPCTTPPPPPPESKLWRRTGAITGAPPTDQGTTIFTLPSGISKDVHVIER